ncbi:MAG: Mo-dependent nitrogenase C-terminal domain-containing protein [Coleofasciculaceae cyanobacterium]
MNVFEHETQKLAPINWDWVRSAHVLVRNIIPGNLFHQRKNLDPFQPVRQWLDKLEVHSPKLAHLICQMIPSQCPFEREVKLFHRTLLRIPPMCKLNPLYEEVVALRFRALCYLADECGEDISAYC